MQHLHLYRDDFDGTAATGSFVIKKYSSTTNTWTSTTTGTRTSTSTQATGVTSFSDFQLGDPNTGLYYKSIATGNWNTIGTWQTSSDSSTWVAASSVPDNTAKAIIISSGNTVTVDGASTYASSISILGTLAISGTNTLYVSGYWQNKGTLTYNTSTVNFNGSQQVIGGTVGTTFYNLTINCQYADTLSGRDITVNNNLNLNAGKIVTMSNTVIMALNTSTITVTNASATCHVYGNFRWTFTSALTGQSRTFPIGDGFTYTPIALTLLNVAAGTITAYNTALHHPNIGTSGIDQFNDCKRYWTLTGSPTNIVSTAAAQFTFSGKATLVDVDPTSDPATNFIVKRYYSSAWNNTTLGTRAATSISITGVTTLGDFVTGEGCATPTAPTGGTATPSSICTGGFSVLALSGGSLGGAGGTGGTGQTIRWYSASSGGTLLTSGNNVEVRPTSTKTYYGCFENTNCSGAPQSSRMAVTVTVTGTTAPSFTAPTSRLLYYPRTSECDHFNLSGGAAPFTYRWKLPVEQGSPYTAPQAGFYTVTVTDNNGCSNRTTYNVGGELITNGNFSQGNTGFTCRLYFFPGNLNPEGLYDVLVNPQLTMACSEGLDPTNPGTDKFLCLNGYVKAGKRVWEENITVTPNTKYYFNAWA